MPTGANAGNIKIVLQPHGNHGLACLGILLDAVLCLPNEDLTALLRSCTSAPCPHHDAAISRGFHVKEYLKMWAWMWSA